MDDLTKQCLEQLRQAKSTTEAPLEIPCNPPVWSRVGLCHLNVAKQVKQHRGEAVTGWRVCHFTGEGYLLCEPHSVWRGRHSSIIDITPLPDGAESKRVVFVPQVLDCAPVMVHVRNGIVSDEDYKRWAERQNRLTVFCWGYTPSGIITANVKMELERTLIDNGDVTGFAWFGMSTEPLA